MPWDKFAKKKKTFCKTFCRITMLSWWFSWFFRIIHVYQCFITLSILFDEVDSGLKHWKKKRKLLDTMYIVFYYGWSELMACSYTCREKILYRKRWVCVIEMTGHHIKKSRFFIASKRLGLPLYISHPKKALKCLLQNTYLLLDLLYHKHNPFIIATVGDSIF